MLQALIISPEHVMPLQHEVIVRKYTLVVFKLSTKRFIFYVYFGGQYFSIKRLRSDATHRVVQVSWDSSGCSD